MPDQYQYRQKYIKKMQFLALTYDIGVWSFGLQQCCFFNLFKHPLETKITWESTNHC